jgi:hypothetical protein
MEEPGVIGVPPNREMGRPGGLRAPQSWERIEGFRQPRVAPLSLLSVVAQVNPRPPASPSQMSGNAFRWNLPR